jgi:hypothetical protein
MMIRHLSVKFDKELRVFKLAKSDDERKTIQVIGDLPYHQLMDWMCVVTDKDNNPIICFEFRSSARDFVELNKDLGYKYYWVLPKEGTRNDYRYYV